VDIDDPDEASVASFKKLGGLGCIRVQNYGPCHIFVDFR
jgi:hypothetical protein